MTAPTVADPVRISKIAGRYLVFDADSVARLRRQQNTCGMLVGTTPQQPTQNIFLGLPIEIREEEASTLVQTGAAVVVDSLAEHQAALRAPGEAHRVYKESLRRRKQAAQMAIAEQKAEAARFSASKKRGSAKAAQSSVTPEAAAAAADGESSLFETDPVQKAPPTEQRPKELAVTPTSSTELLSAEIRDENTVGNIPGGPLSRFLQNEGYYMTPGLRFGSQYSIYPGDPLRFHAHFMANEYGWDEPIPIVNIVGGGRLATAVKKAFLLGGEEPPGPHGESLSDGRVRTFSVEWAAM